MERIDGIVGGAYAWYALLRTNSLVRLARLYQNLFRLYPNGFTVLPMELLVLLALVLVLLSGKKVQHSLNRQACIQGRQASVIKYI